MADNTNPVSGQGQTIDLRAQTPAPAAVAGAAQPAAAGAQTGAATTQDQSVFDKFDIPQAVRDQHPDLIPMILQTESMNDDERQYWFQILPIMTDDQILKLREILANEKQQLQKLDKEYDGELKKINDKHVSEWKEFEAKEKRQKLKAAESASSQAEKQTEEELLKKLQEL
ncbi:MAG: hypothetical protein WCT53_05085 [Candidatus Gracilibacteria bacterium]